MKAKTTAFSISLIILSFILHSCSSPEKNTIAYTISEKDLFPEGIAYSAVTNSLYVGSMKNRKIVRIDMESGKVSDFVKPGVINMAVLGMIADDNRNILWACANMWFDGIRHSGVFKFNLSTGSLIKSYENKSDKAGTYNDITFDGNGDVYFTDTDGDRIFRISQDNDSASVYFNGDEIHQPNGITFSPDFKYLYVASQTRGIRVIEKRSGSLAAGPDTSFNSLGIDGLKYYKNSLIGLQNDVSPEYGVRLTRYFLNSAGTKITGTEVIDRDNKLFHIPTTFALDKGTIYCIANSQMDNLRFPEYETRDSTVLRDINILRYELR